VPNIYTVQMTRNVPNTIREYAETARYITPQDLARRFGIKNRTAYNSLSRLRSSGVLTRTGYGRYESKPSKRSRFPVSKRTKDLNSLIKNRMPLLDFTIWGTEDLGYLTHDTMGKNAIMIDVDPRYLQSLRDLLLEEGLKAIANPTRDVMRDIFDYFDQPVLLFGRRERYATEIIDGLRRPTVERLITDLYILVSRKEFQFPLRELVNVISGILRTTSLSPRRLRRYARRRGAWDGLGQLFYLLAREDPTLDLPEELVESGRSSVEPILDLCEGLR